MDIIIFSGKITSIAKHYFYVQLIDINWHIAVMKYFFEISEFLHGHLNNPGELPAVICFRSKSFDDARRQEALASNDKRGVAKFSSESELATQLMDDLKARVKASEQQVSCHWYMR